MDEFSIEIDGAELTGVELGDGLPVVFLHAGVCDNRMWHEQMRVAAESGWHAIAYDRRGYGDSTSADDVRSSKPCPDIFSAALGKAGVTPGEAVVVDSEVPGFGRAAFVDTRATLGHYTEYGLWAPGVLAALSHMRDAHRGWSGDDPVRAYPAI